MKKKWFAMVLTVMLALAVFAGCSGGNNAKQELDPAFNEDTLKQAAEKVVGEWNQQNFEAMAAEVADNVKDKLTADILKEAWDKTMPKLGAFKSFNQSQIVPNNGEASVVLIGEYENAKAQYTVTFNTDMRLTGFYIK